MRRHDSRVSLFARQARLASGWVPEPCYAPPLLSRILRGTARPAPSVGSELAWILFLLAAIALALWAPAL